MPGFDEVIPGYRLHDATQFQFTLTKAWGYLSFLRADQGLLLFEPAIVHVSGMPSKDVLRYEGPGTYTSGNPIHSRPAALTQASRSRQPEHFADPTSWGYRLVGRLTYNNAIGAFNLIPRFGWRHDVDGITPGPGGAFIDGRQAFTLGLGMRATWPSGSSTSAGRPTAAPVATTSSTTATSSGSTSSTRSRGRKA